MINYNIRILFLICHLILMNAWNCSHSFDSINLKLQQNVFRHYQICGYAFGENRSSLRKVIRFLVLLCFICKNKNDIKFVNLYANLSATALTQSTRNFSKMLEYITRCVVMSTLIKVISFFSFYVLSVNYVPLIISHLPEVL